MKDIQWTEVVIPVVQVNESVNSRILPDGQLLESYNCEFSTKEGSCQKRPGLVSVATGPVDHAFKRIATHQPQNQVLAVDLDGTNDESPALYTLNETDASLRKVSYVTNALVEKSSIATDLQSDIISDVAYVNGFLVYGLVHIQTGKAWVKVVETVGTDIEKPGNTVFEQEFDYAPVLDPDAGQAFWVRCTASTFGAVNQVMVTWQCLGDPDAMPVFQGTIWGVVIDVSSTIPTVFTDITTIVVCAPSKLYDDDPFLGIPAGSVTDAHFHDTCGSTTSTGLSAPNWIIAFRETGEQLEVMRVDNALAVDWTNNPGDIIGIDVFAVTVLEDDNIIWLNWYDRGNDNPGWYVATFDTDVGTPSLVPTLWCDSTDITADALSAPDWISGISPTEVTDEVILFHSQGYGPANDHPPGFDRRAITRWRRCTNIAGLGSLREKRGPRLLSKPWRDPNTQGWYQAWTSVQVITEVGVDGNGVNASGTRFARTAVLFRFCENDQPDLEAERHRAIPLTSISGLALAPQIQYGKTVGVEPEFLVQCPASVTNVLPSQFAEAEKLGFRTTINIQYVPGEEKGGPWDVGVRWYENQDTPEGFGRYTSVKYGGSTYFAGGLLTQWDGSRHHETGFIVQPNISFTGGGASAGSGDWGEEWIQQNVFYQAVYESVHENGERVRSAASAVVRATLGGTPDSGGGAVLATNDITLYLEPHTITMRNFGPLQDDQGFDTPRTLVTIYRSITPNGTELHRIWQFDVNKWDALVTDPDQLDHITWVDPGSEADSMQEIEETEVIYTDSGELDNDIPFGGCTSITVHKERIWVSSGDDPEILWYSKERAEGRPAEFSLFQQIRIPGNKIVAVSSVGEGLIVLCEHAVFSVLGEGPAATGDPSSGTFQIVPISYQNGCLSSSSVVKTPLGVIFRAEPGYFLCNGRELVFIGKAIQDTADRELIPISNGVASDWMQARWCTGVRADYGSESLIYDWDANKWSVWYHQIFDADAGNTHIVGMAQMKDRIFCLGSDGKVYLETEGVFADDGNPYRQSVKFGWLSFGRVQGHKKLRKMGILLSPNPWANQADEYGGTFGIRINADYNYAESGFSSSKFFSSDILDDILPRDGITWLRIHLPYQKQPSIRPEIVEEPPIVGVSSSPIVGSTIDTTAGNNVLRIKSAAADSFTVITVTVNAALTLTQLVTELNEDLEGIDLVASISSTNRIVITTVDANYVEIDSVANGSTLNTAATFNVLGIVGTYLLAPDNQSGFILNCLSFEVGQIQGMRRLPAGQSG